MNVSPLKSSLLKLSPLHASRRGRPLVTRLVNRLANLLVALPLLLIAPMLHAHDDHGKPQFGGVVVEAGHAQMELVSRNGQITVHVTNHGAPVDMGKARGRLTVLEGGGRRDVELAPAGANRLGAAGTLAAGAKVVIQVQQAGGKPWQGRVTMP